MPRRAMLGLLGLLGLLVVPSRGLEPLSVGLAVGVASALTGYLSSPRFYCSFVECCPGGGGGGGGGQEDLPNGTALKAHLEEKLFGQHLAKEVILKAVTGFVSNPEPKKPLALSLHGWAGTGKNFVSQILAENVHRRGLKSKYVHLFLATLHFPHNHQVPLYKVRAKATLRRTGGLASLGCAACAGTVFPGACAGISPAGISPEFHVSFNARRAWEIPLVLSFAGGLWHSSLIDRNLIDYFVPFLPLEYKHVKMCIRAEIRSRGDRVDETVVQKVADEMTFFPKDERIYSDKGCKTVQAKLNFY